MFSFMIVLLYKNKKIKTAKNQGKVIAFQPQTPGKELNKEGKKSVLPLLFFLFTCSAFAQEQEKPFHINQPLPDTLCFTAKIATYRKSAWETFYEVKITCKNCAEEDFKNFPFYKRILYKTVDEALEAVRKGESDCRLFKPVNK
jgi:hypothetical protein